jgi:hypothetical protein
MDELREIEAVVAGRAKQSAAPANEFNAALADAVAHAISETQRKLVPDAIEPR